MSAHERDVVGQFYGLSAIAEQVDDDNVARWLAALVLLLCEDAADTDRVLALAQEAAEAVRTKEGESP